MIKLLVRYAVLILLMPKQQAFAQCPPASEVIQQVGTIQASNSSNEDKIKQLRQLQKESITCSKAKDSVYARIAHRIGDIYSKAGDFEKAINYTKEAIAVNSGNNKRAEKSYLAYSYYNLASFYKTLYFYDEAQNYYDSCINIATQFPNAYFLVFLGIEQKAYAFFQNGDYQKSIETSDNGLLFAKKITDTLHEALLLCQKAQSQVELSEIPEAEQNIKKAIDILKKNNKVTNLATGYSIYAHLSERKGNIKSAIQYYKKSLELNKSENNWTQCSRDMLNLGFLYDSTLKDGPRAMACYQEGIKMIEKANDVYQLAALYNNIGVHYWRQRNYKMALQFYQKGLNVLPVSFTDTSLRSNPTSNMLKMIANNYFVGTMMQNKGESLLDEYRVKKNKDLLQSALNAYQATDNTVDLMRWKQSGDQSKLLWRERTKRWYEYAIETCYLLNDIEKAFYFFEKSRAVLLSDKLSELGAKRFISQTDRAKEQQLRIKVFSANNQVLSLDESSASYDNAKRQLLSAQDETEKFIKSLEQKYPVYYQYKYDNTVYPLAAIKNKLLAGNQSLVEYFTTDSAVYILFLSQAKDSFLKVPLKDYSSTAKRLMALCSDKSLNQNYTEYRSLAYHLYDKLFRPLNVPGGRVIISPDDYFIPFEALLSDADSPSSFLVKKYAFSYAYSMGLLMKTNNNHSAPGNTFLGIAPVNYQPYLHQQSLQGSAESLENIKSYFPSADFLIHEKATRQQFLKNISRYNIVQVYSHADADSSYKQPLLYLSDSTINLSELQTLEEIQTNLIVLSACKTGVGKNIKGEGIFSLARGFTAAGIPATVTTLWQVNNKPTYLLTEAFYKYLSQKLPKDEALQKAKLEFLENNDKTYEVPYYWAAIIMLGNTDIISEKAPVNKIPVFLLVIASSLIILLIVFLGLRKPAKKL